MKKIAIIFGTRPEAIKLAPLILALKESKWAEPYVISTGQHRELLQQVLSTFSIRPDIELNIMRDNQSLSELTARLIERLNPLFKEQTFSYVLGQGDTTTLLCSALVAFYHRVSFGHVEAGLRTGEKYNPFPEEMNRVLASRLADCHFAPTRNAADNLGREGIAADRIFVTGNTGIDSLRILSDHARLPEFFNRGFKRHVFVTTHRRENFGQPMQNICSAVDKLIARFTDVQWIVQVHPNPNVRDALTSRIERRKNVELVDPLTYTETVAMLKHSDLVLTDSGGLQEEAPYFGKPVFVLRDSTERPEIISEGIGMLVGTSVDTIISKVSTVLDDVHSYDKMARRVSPYGDGFASQRILEVLHQRLELQR